MSVDQLVQTGREPGSHVYSYQSPDRETTQSSPGHNPTYPNQATPLKSLESSTSTFGVQSRRNQRTENDFMSWPSQDSEGKDGFVDFFGPEIFQVVLYNPTTAHRFLRYCQSMSCAENIEFLCKVNKYRRLLDEMTSTLFEIHSMYTSVEAVRQINISYPLIEKVSGDIKHATQVTIPAMEDIFSDSQVHVESLLESDMYRRFVKHQITTSTTMALASDREKFPGLGDCFCMTDTSIADNPIVFASDGFVEVTGYSRRDIVPRNCRFLQGPLTDKISVGRLRSAIKNGEETVELILNYRKNGDPFWNLLYISPLVDEDGRVRFFLGGQINCSTTIHSRTDVLRILSLNDEGLTEQEAGDERNKRGPPGGRGGTDSPPIRSTKSNFFKSVGFHKTKTPEIKARSERGMEGELLDKLAKLDFSTQVEAFYTSYSKYLMLKYSPSKGNLTISYYSPGIIDMLRLNLPDGDTAPIHNKEIFKVLSEHSGSPFANKSLKYTVMDSIRVGSAVSIELGLMTGSDSQKGGFSFMGKQRVVSFKEQYVSHWTPLKDEEGRTGWVILAIVPK